MTQPIDTRQLNIFVEVAKNCNMSSAAKKLFITSSAVSHSIKNLEEDLSCSLFIRNASSLKLTKAGHLLLKKATLILSLSDQTRNEIDEIQLNSPDRITIATSTSMGTRILPCVVQKYQLLFPEIQIKLITANGKDLKNIFTAKGADIILFPTTVDVIKEDTMIIAKDELRFVVNRNHRWVSSGQCEFESCKEPFIIASDNTSYTSKNIIELLENFSVPESQFMEVSDEGVVKNFVKESIGVGILPDWTIKDELIAKDLSSFPIGKRRFRRSWHLFLQKDPNATPFFKIFVELLKNEAHSCLL